VKTFTIVHWQTVFAALSLTTITLTTNPAAAQVLRGTGDSFAAPLYQGYSKEYERQTGEKFRYTVVGSAGGIRLFANKSVDFAGTSLIPTPIEQNQFKAGLLMIPTGGGAIAIIYNLQDVSAEVQLSRDTLAKIFTGQISNWQQVNPRFPNKKIQVVVNSQSSGTNFTLTKYLRKITGGKIEASRNPNWGFQVFSAFDEDSSIAGEVVRVDGAIGYVQTSFAHQRDLRIAQIENRARRYVKPTLKETEKALAKIKFNDDFTTEDIIDPEDGYPLVSLSWLLFSKEYANQDILEKNRKLVTWILTQGQELNQQSEYTKIPKDVANKIMETAKSEMRVRPF
jgi:phosphate transport system substrate-binding protein